MFANKITFFIIPGFKMQTKDKAFAWLVRYLEDKNYTVIKVPVKWKYRTLTQNTASFATFFNKHKGSINHVLGFSYGAVIALLSASHLKPYKLYLCSLSPDFYEDTSRMKKPEIRYIGKRRFMDTQTRSAREFAKNLKVPAVIFYGEEEGKRYPQLKKRCEETAHFVKKSKLVIVHRAPHKIDFPEYIRAIKKELPNY